MAGVKIISRGERVFGAFNALFMILLSCMMLIPFLAVLKDSVDLGGQGDISIALIPKEFTLMYYQMVFNDSGVYRPFLNSVGVTVVGTTLALVVNSMAAYTMSKRNLRGGRFFVYFLVVIPIIFHGGGIIANYVWFKFLGILNTYMVLILPLLVQGFWIVIIRQYYWTIPDSITESAEIDGAGEFRIFLRIIAPMSKAVFAAYTLFKGVAFWNDWLWCLLYVHDPDKYVFPVKLRGMFFWGQEAERFLRDFAELLGVDPMETLITMEGLSSAIIIVAVIPVLIVYPYLQRYFATGVRVGALKG
jgi:putative aldouronate transport system permease protein